MALTFTRVLDQPVTTQTINTTATYTSSEVDIGASTIAEQIFAYLEVDGFASTPTGTMIMGLPPVHTTGGSVFDDVGITHPFTVAADQQYQFPLRIASLSRFFKMTVKNNTDVNTDANAVDAWVEHMDVTA